MATSFWFKSSEFKVISGEDDDTNTGRYGKAVAKWLANALIKEGYSASFGPEDWGWRVECLAKPYAVWIGCGNVDHSQYDGESDNAEIVWHCFVEADKPFLKSLFSKFDPSAEIAQVSKSLEVLLDETTHITLVSEP